MRDCAKSVFTVSLLGVCIIVCTRQSHSWNHKAVCLLSFLSMFICFYRDNNWACQCPCCGFVLLFEMFFFYPTTFYRYTQSLRLTQWDPDLWKTLSSLAVSFPLTQTGPPAPPSLQPELFRGAVVFWRLCPVLNWEGGSGVRNPIMAGTRWQGNPCNPLWDAAIIVLIAHSLSL